MTPKHSTAIVAAALINTLGVATAFASSEPRLDVPSQPVATSALMVALEAGLSVRLEATCHGLSPALHGQYTAKTAMARILADSDCVATWIGPATLRIGRRPVASSVAIIEPRRTPEPTTRLGDIVVTASKMDVVAFNLAGSVTQITAGQLSAAQSLDTRDLSLLASGMTVTNLGPGRDKVLLRGLSDGAFTGHTQSTVGIYWDETPTTYNAPDPDLRLVDIHSVEVLRGPQGTLYGAGAIGGVVSIAPNKPAFDRASGSLALTGATTTGGAPSADAEGVFNTPLLNGRAAARLVAYGEDDGGYIAEPRLDSKRSNSVRRIGARASVSLQITPQWTATLGDTYQNIHSDDTQYTTSPGDRLVRDTQVHEPHDNVFEQVYLDIAGHGGWGDIRSVSSFIDHEFDSRYDATDAAAAFGGAVGAPSAYDEDTHIRLTSQEIDYHPPTLGRLKLLTGAYGAYGDELEISSFRPVGATALYVENRTDRLIDLALFGEADYAITARLSLTVGLRAFYAERRTLSSVIQGASTEPFSGQTSMHDVAPKAALQYRITPSAMVYGLASEGYRASGFNTAATIGQTFTAQGDQQPNRAYLPDTLWNYEVGAKIDGFGGRLSLRTALYYDVWSRLQADQFLPSGLAYVANVGNAQVYGSEWELSLKPTQRLSLQLGALLTAPDLHEVNPTFAAGRSDFTLPGVARRSFNGQIGYDIPLPAERSLSLNAAAVYIGHSYLFFGPQTSATMGDYLNARLSATLTSLSWVWTASVDNPGDTRGDTFAFGNPFSLATGAQMTPMRPRTVSLALKRSI